MAIWSFGTKFFDGNQKLEPSVAQGRDGASFFYALSVTPADMEYCAMDVAFETRVSLTKAAQLYDVALSTTYRWHLRGVSGVKLETTRIGGKRVTTLEALERFHAAVTAAADGVPSQRPEPETSRRKRLERVDRELAAAGFVSADNASRIVKGKMRDPQSGV